MSQLLTTYSFTEEDINLLTFALRRLKDSTDFSNIKNDAENLLDFIERQKEEQKQTNSNTKSMV